MVSTLRKSLTRNNYRDKCSGKDINIIVLERKKRTTLQLLSGCQLHDVRDRGVKSYRKALLFTSQKLDLQTDQPKESGTTVDDIIDFVRVKMYRWLKTKIEDSKDDEGLEDIDSDIEVNNNVDGEGGDSDNIEDDELEVPDEYIFSGFCVYSLGSICTTR